MDIYIFLLPLVLCASCTPWNFKMQTFFISLNFHCKQNIANHSCFKLSELKIVWHLNESCKQMLTQNFTAQSLRQEDMLQICWHKFLPSIDLACYGQASRILWNHFGASFYELSIVKIVIWSLQACYMEILLNKILIVFIYVWLDFMSCLFYLGPC